MPRICCIRGCHSEPNMLIHRFPRDKYMCKEWARATGMEHISLDDLPHTKVVCGFHFRQSDYQTTSPKRLIKTAIPSINLQFIEDIFMEHSYFKMREILKMSVNNCEHNYFKLNANVGRGAARYKQRVTSAAIPCAGTNDGSRGGTSTTTLHSITKQHSSSLSSSPSDTRDGMDSSSADEDDYDQDQEDEDFGRYIVQEIKKLPKTRRNEAKTHIVQFLVALDNLMESNTV